MTLVDLNSLNMHVLPNGVQIDAVATVLLYLKAKYRIKDTQKLKNYLMANLVNMTPNAKKHSTMPEDYSILKSIIHFQTTDLDTAPLQLSCWNHLVRERVIGKKGTLLKRGHMYLQSVTILSYELLLS